MEGDRTGVDQQAQKDEELREKMRAFFTHLLGRPVDDAELERLLSGASDGNGRFRTRRTLH